MTTLKSSAEALAGIPATGIIPIVREPIDIPKWADYFQFKLVGTPDEIRQTSRMVEAAAQFILDVQDHRAARWLSLLGSSGSGKTMLAKAVHAWCRTAAWCSWPMLSGELQNNEGYGELNDLMDERIIVVDEIGADRDKSGHVRDCLGRLCSTRTGRWTLLTSNLSLGEVQKGLDARIASRMLRDGSVVVDVSEGAGVRDYNVRNRKVSDGRLY